MQGFFVGFTSAGANGYIAGVNTGNGFTDYAVKVTVSSMYGGASSVAMGGSFSDGASNAARIMLLNDMGNVVNDRLTRMAMGQEPYVNTSADNAAYGSRPDNAQQIKQLGDTVMAIGVIPPLAPVALTAGVLIHLSATKVDLSYGQALGIDMVVYAGSNALGGNLPANVFMYIGGMAMEK